jgi:hypothetical protein
MTESTLASTGGVASRLREHRAIALVSSAHFVNRFQNLVLPPLFPFLKAALGIGFLDSQKSGDGDSLRAVAEAVLQILMEADVEGLIGAGRHERSADRLNGCACMARSTFSRSRSITHSLSMAVRSMASLVPSAWICSRSCNISATRSRISAR